ncbi:MAG: hypothetical protein LKF53_03055 [Solobacterium sp.]|jgi:uncharacterized membrane protein YcgQ (UPF0703/DUF1980 family)|nr:hypothetical protein [Solobacterium sp.]MCH4205358.1 hypothetical protein [Solobacterium sp.]MCH4226945.1 hypothetical protein [Solobacterium sp.]MCH4282263.1 hypothetical protein [Solobacterium sp.]
MPEAERSILKKISVFACTLLLALNSGCESEKATHYVPTKEPSSNYLDIPSSSPSSSASAVSEGSVSEDQPVPSAASETPAAEEPSSTAAPSAAASSSGLNNEYPYSIQADRPSFDASHINITVGDSLYATQINDWFMNFSEYAGKSVAIEGFYMKFGGYTYVGRKGPTCPYCTGGYVNFEFQTDQDLSSLVSESSWIKVSGLLRQGTMYPQTGQAGQPFYYIEAIRIEKMPQVGVTPISN